MMDDIWFINLTTYGNVIDMILFMIFNNRNSYVSVRGLSD